MTTLEKTVIGVVTSVFGMLGAWAAAALLAARTDIATMDVRVRQLETQSVSLQGVPAQLAVLTTQMTTLSADVAKINVKLETNNRRQ